MTGSRETLERRITHDDELIQNVRQLLRQVERMKDGTGRQEFVFETADDVRETLKKMEAN